MASVTYHVVVPFDRNGDGELEPGEPKEAPLAEMAQGGVALLARSHAGVVAFSRAGYPATGDRRPAILMMR